MNMRVANIKTYSLIYGFEPCFVIWTQGCPLHCKGCWNQDTWDFHGGYEISIDDILGQIEIQRKSEKPISAVTILGGEPFYQYESLSALVSGIRAMDLGIICYSGYEIDELVAMKKDSIFRDIDVLISGRYEESLRDTTLQLRGSSNQTLTFLSQRYSQKNIRDANYVEFEIDEFGAIGTFGYPDLSIIPTLATKNQ